MKYCSECGNQITEKDKFCSECGNAVNNRNNTAIEKQSTLDNNPQITQNKKLAENTITGIGIALFLVGLIVGICTIIFIASSGKSFDYDSWNYYYGGGRETAISIAVFAGISLLVGLCMLIAASVSNKENKSITETETTPDNLKKCSYCGKLSAIEVERCSCGCLVFDK